jgi:hypothetical protein
MAASNRDREKIAFVGLCAGAGVTTLAFSAAEFLAARSKKAGLRITMLEIDPKEEAPAGRAYDKVGIDRRFAGRDFMSFYKTASEGKPLQNVLNIDEGVNWALRLPGENGPAPSAATLFRLLNNVSGDIILCDIPAYSFFNCALGRDSLTALLAEMDRIICIFDPLPSRLLASVRTAEACRSVSSAGVETIFVFNKYNSGVDIREATRFTGVRDFIPFPVIPADVLYKAEYACRSIAFYPEAETALTLFL